MSFLVGVLTFLLVINCLLLILLVLVQLPKKDAGAGLAFGGGTADALFGSGSGNVLTKVTKYATVAFLVMALLLGYLQDRAQRGNGVSATDFIKQVQQKQMQAPVAAPAPKAAASPANNLLTTVPATASAAAATNPPAAK
ncbi:MAG: preprotein translocase subunit SecG [Verrucomicrobiota bacterium]